MIFSSGSCRMALPLTRLHKEGKISLVNPLWDEFCFFRPEGVLRRHIGMFHNLHDHYRLFNLLYPKSFSIFSSSFMFLHLQRLHLTYSSFDIFIYIYRYK